MKAWVPQTPTKTSSIKVMEAKPELFLFRGYDAVRQSSGVIHVWLTCACESCQEGVKMNDTFVRTDATDVQLQRHGVNLWIGEQPSPGRKVHSESPVLCERCYKEWLNFKRPHA